jgi:ABC-type phosphate transport system substrate-binding protein
VNIAKRYALLGVLAITAATGACNSFLEGGELSNDPNRPVTSTPQARFAGTQPSLWALLSSDMTRVNEVWVQHFEGLSTGAGQSVQIPD